MSGRVAKAAVPSVLTFMLLEFLSSLVSCIAKTFGPFLRGVWVGFREREGSIYSNHQHFAISTGIPYLLD